MIAPYAHVATLEEAEENVVTEMMLLTRLAQKNLRTAYQAPGFNLGMNIGSSAGAGIAGHIHMHVLPRWSGDVNFMTDRWRDSRDPRRRGRNVPEALCRFMGPVTVTNHPGPASIGHDKRNNTYDCRLLPDARTSRIGR